MRILKNIGKCSCIALLALFYFCLLLMTMCVVNVYGAEKYSEVLEDLKTDNNFNIRDYPALTYEELENENLLNVIQIAETTEKELCIYVYQPTSDTLEIVADSVSISSEFSSNGQNLNPFVYDLELVSNYDVFYKYVVKDYKVSSEAYRYYNIVAIYRPFNELIDEEIEGSVDIGNITLVALGIGQQWCCYYLNDNLIYEMNTFNTLDIEINYKAKQEFKNGLTLGNFVGNFKFGYLHYIAFNVDEYIIKKIYDARLNYQIRKHTEVFGLGIGTNHVYGEYENKYVHLSSEDKGTFKGEGLGAREYTWNRISSASDFVSEMEKQNIPLEEDYRNEILKNQWVFAFLETEMSTLNYDGGYTNIYYDVDNVRILRLHFLDINNKVYDLGVVSNGISGGGISGSASGIDLSFILDPIQKILMVVGIILLIIVIVFIFNAVGVVKDFLKEIIEAIIFVIKLPFSIIKSIFGIGKNGGKRK